MMDGPEICCNFIRLHTNKFFHGPFPFKNKTKNWPPILLARLNKVHTHVMEEGDDDDHLVGNL